MKKQTAVEWLAEKLEKGITGEDAWFDLLDKAKEMEKQQIIEASKESIKICGMSHVFIEYPEQYYDKTFKQD